MADDESSDGHTTADSSSLSSDGEDEPDLQSMTARGVQHLCSELLELKQESDEDFQRNIFSNYYAFLAIMKDIQVLQHELLEMKNKAALQKKLVKQVSDTISEENIEAMLRETTPTESSSSSPTLLETHAQSMFEIFDTYLAEHRLDEALDLLQTEREYVENLEYSSDQIISYKSNISEKSAILSRQLAMLAKNPRVPTPELQKALLGLRQLGDDHLANQLLLQHYHSRIASKIPREIPNLLYIREAAKFVCSMICQCVMSFAAVNGEDKPYSAELIQWTNEEIKVLSICLIKYIESISDISGRLWTAVEAVQIGMKYCWFLERERIYLQACLRELIRPCVEEVMDVHVKHLSKVLIMVTSNDAWILERYNVSGMLAGKRSSAAVVVDQEPRCFFLTNSGRKFATLFQCVAEEILPLIAFGLESSVVKGMMELFTAYVGILESAITGETDAEKDGFGINLAETPTEGVFILANASTLMQFALSIIKNMFDGRENHAAAVVEEIYSRLKSCFLAHLISNIFSPNAADHETTTEIRITSHDTSTSSHLIPSLPYLELYLELKKLEKLGEDECLDTNWLTSLLREVVDATFEWMWNNTQNLIISTEIVADNRTNLMQLSLDTQFVVEMAKQGAYLSENAINMSKDIISGVEASLVSAGLSPVSDEEWPAKAAILALEKLKQLHTNEEDSLDALPFPTHEEESHHHSATGDENPVLNTQIEEQQQ